MLILKLKLTFTRYASQAVHRFAKQDMPVYDNFVTAFVSNNFQALFEALESGTNGMREDHFLGLVRLLNTYSCCLLFNVCCHEVPLFGI
jgi:hypothetical protein